MRRLFINKGSDEAHEFLLFWPATTAEEGGDLNVLNVPTRRSIGLVADKHGTRGITDQVPPITTWALIKLPCLFHAGLIPVRCLGSVLRIGAGREPSSNCQVVRSQPSLAVLKSLECGYEHRHHHSHHTGPGLIGVLPTWGHSRSWGYGPSGIVGVIVVVLIILLVMGRL